MVVPSVAHVPIHCGIIHWQQRNLPYMYMQSRLVQFPFHSCLHFGPIFFSALFLSSVRFINVTNIIMIRAGRAELAE